MSTAVLVAELLLKYGPDVAQSFQRWFSGEQPKADDWARVFALARKTPDDYRREAEAELDRK